MDPEAPLELSELRHRVLPWALEWMKKAEDEEKAWQAENEVELNGNGAHLFATPEENEEEEPHKYRIRAWYTSPSNPDGYAPENWELPHQDTAVNKDAQEWGVRAVYLLSESWQGYGDILWSSARHVSNLLGNAASCREILTPLLLQKVNEKDSDRQRHPLFGLAFVELGAGAGVPSWVALRCGARVVCTDQAVPDRIRSIAECAERNFREMKSTETDPDVLAMAAQARACSLDWGESVEDVLECLDADKKERFDVVVAADCCYQPWLQPRLLQSIYQLMSNEGVALLPFALHGNAKDEEVWRVVDRAKDQGFRVQILQPQQLTPPVANMDLKQGLVQTVRLTKK